jgi:hypothetical protein
MATGMALRAATLAEAVSGVTLALKFPSAFPGFWWPYRETLLEDFGLALLNG